VARTALQTEITKRNLSALVVEYPPGDELEMRQRVTIRAFRDLPEALLAKGSLDSAGIDCALVDDNVVRMDWLWSNSMGGVKLQVDADDVPAAEEILTQPIPEHFDVSGLGEYEQPRCPKCGSLDVNFQELDPAAYLSVALVPVPFHRKAWRCRSCHIEWEDDGSVGPAESSTLLLITFADYVLRICGEVERRKFVARKPADFGGVAGGCEFAANLAAEEINQYVVILHALFGVAQDAVVDAEQLSGLDDESSLFAGLADSGFANEFADFQHSSGDGPLGLQRRVSALDEKDAVVLDDDGADSDQRDFGELALHGASILKRVESLC
jgi:hypothetical protein